MPALRAFSQCPGKHGRWQSPRERVEARATDTTALCWETCRDNARIQQQRNCWPPCFHHLRHTYGQPVVKARSDSPTKLENRQIQNPQSYAIDRLPPLLVLPSGTQPLQLSARPPAVQSTTESTVPNSHLLGNRSCHGNTQSKELPPPPAAVLWPGPLQQLSFVPGSGWSARVLCQQLALSRPSGRPGLCSLPGLLCGFLPCFLARWMRRLTKQPGLNFFAGCCCSRCLSPFLDGLGVLLCLDLRRGGA